MFQAKFIRGFWLTSLGLFTLGASSYFFYPIGRWAELGIVACLSMIVTMWLCFAASRFYPTAAMVLMLCCTILGPGWLIRYPVFIKFTGLGGIAPVIFAFVPCLLLPLVWSWRGALLGIGLSLMVLVPQRLFGEFLLGVFAVVAFSSVGLLFHFTIRELEKAYDKLEQAARTDSLTKLGNRRALREDFAQVKFAWLSLWDLNGLKQINDQQGHEAGDAFILEFVRCLQQAAPDLQPIYRVGGDEFVVLHHSNPKTFVATVQHAFGSVAAGMTELSNLSLDDALRLADSRMYQDKEQRKALGSSRG